MKEYSFDFCKVKVHFAKNVWRLFVVADINIVFYCHTPDLYLGFYISPTRNPYLES